MRIILLTVVLSMAQLAQSLHTLTESAYSYGASPAKCSSSKVASSFRVLDADLIKLDGIVKYDYHSTTGQCDKKSTKKSICTIII